MGIYAGLGSGALLDNLIVGSLLLIGIWNLIFSGLGILGIRKRRKEFVNYFTIGIIISMAFILSYLLCRMFLETNSNCTSQDSRKICVMFHYLNLFTAIIVPIHLIIHFILLIFSCSFQRIYKDDLHSYVAI